MISEEAVASVPAESRLPSSFAWQIRVLELFVARMGTMT